MAKATDEYSVKVTADDQATKTLNKIGDNLKSGLGTIGKVGLVGLGIAATGATAALGAFGAGLKFAIDEAIEAQQVQAQLQAVLEATGGVAGVTADMANELANSLMGVTRFTDEEILSGENLLLTFKNIGKDVFPEVTEVMLDMSTAMGQDLKSSAIQLGKALNDPTVGLSALSRVGVTFTEQQKEEIKALQESGDLLGAQNILLQELQSEFGGSAKAAGETFAGQLDILKNQMSNVAEEAGNVLLPVLTEGLKSVTPIIMDLVNQFANFVKSDQFQQWVEKLVSWLKNDLPAAIARSKQFFNEEIKPVLESIIPILRDDIGPLLKEVFHIIGVIAPPLIKAFVIGWKIQIEVFKTLWTIVENIIISFKNLFNLITGNADKMEKLKIPDWLVPGSPTPLELGLRGINKELGGMLSLAPIAVNNTAPLVTGGGTGGSQVIVNINSPVLGFSDKYALAQELGPIITQYLARR